MEVSISVEHEIRDLLRRYLQAIHDKDADAVAALFSGESAIYSLAPPLAQDGSAASGVAQLRRWFQTWDGPVAQDTPDWHIVAVPGCAFAYGLTRMSGRKVGGDDDALWFRQTLAFTRGEGEWPIRHVHDSVPFAMDGSLRALVELTPESTVDPSSAVGAAGRNRSSIDRYDHQGIPVEPRLHRPADHRAPEVVGGLVEAVDGDQLGLEPAAEDARVRIADRAGDGAPA